MMKIEVKGASCKVGFNKVLSGSVLKGTVNVRWKSVMTHLKLESEAPRERIATLIRNAKQACPAETLITQQVTLTRIGHHRQPRRGALFVQYLGRSQLAACGLG